MNIKHLQYIVEIANQQNLTRAAEQLYISQPTLSLYLNRLESELGCKLFIRHKNYLTLTPAGELYVDTARKVIQMKNNLYKQLEEISATQRLRIGIASQKAVGLFTKVYLAIKHSGSPQIDITEGRSEQMVKLLAAEKLDLAILTRDHLPDNMNFDLLKKERMLLVMSPGHPLAHLASRDYKNPPVVDLTLFKDENFVMPPKDTVNRQIINRVLKRSDINPTVVYEINSTQATCQMVCEDMALSFLPDFCIPSSPPMVFCAFNPPSYRYTVLGYREHLILGPEGEDLVAQIKKIYEEDPPDTRNSLEYNSLL
ncbi:MAG: LysR family transcriptional regulator [Clostridiaceae bacterium]|nr:LysR family transcriptional regulator [Clostridiaceae bacterium]